MGKMNKKRGKTVLNIKHTPVSGQDTDILKKYTLGLKIVKEEVIDFKDSKTLNRVFKEIEKVYDV